MNGIEAVGLYTGLSGLIFLALIVGIGRVRKEHKVWLGDGGNPAVLRAVRGQGNFVEYVPLILIGLAIMALTGAAVWLIHLIGAVMVIGRICHASHFMKSDAPMWTRSAGAITSLLSVLVISLYLIGAVVF